MALTHSTSNINTNGLLLYLDAANNKSWTANTKNLIQLNPTPTSASGYLAGGGNGSITYDSANQAVLFTRVEYSSWGSFFYSNQVFSGNIDSTKTHTASFEWYSESDPGIGYRWELVRGDGVGTTAFADVLANSVPIGNNWYRFSYTFTPSNNGNNAHFRVITLITNFQGAALERRKTYFMWRKLQLEQNSVRTDFVDGTQATSWNDVSGNGRSLANSSLKDYATFNGGCVWFRGDFATNGFTIPSSMIDLEALGQTRNFTVMFGVRKKYYGFSGNNTGNGVILNGAGSGYGQGWRIIEEVYGSPGAVFSGTYIVNLATGGVGQGITISDTVANRPAIAAFSVSPTTIYAFLNQNSASVATPTYIPGFHLGQIGTTNYGVGSFAGDFYFMMIYNRALSAAEILENYNALKLRYGL
jgi:hypothetical protein